MDCSGVARWLCGDSGMGAASFGPLIWLNAAQMPTGGVVVSMKPIDTSEGTLMRAAQFTVSKYCGGLQDFRIVHVPERIADLAAMRVAIGVGAGGHIDQHVR